MNITLLDGRVIDIAAINFDPSDYSFSVWYADGNGKENITTLIRRADKMRFAGFDGDFYNNLLYVQKYQREHNGQLPPEVGSTSIWGNFVQQILTDPLAAPLETLDNFVDQIFSSKGVLVIVGVSAGLLILYIAAKRS